MIAENGEQGTITKISSFGKKISMLISRDTSMAEDRIFLAEKADWVSVIELK